MNTTLETETPQQTEQQQTGVQIANTALNNYWSMLSREILELGKSTKNGSKQKAYIDVLKLINKAKTKWNKQLESYQP